MALSDRQLQRKVRPLIDLSPRLRSIRMMCRLFGGSRSGYFDWCFRTESTRSRRKRGLALVIRQLHLETNGV